FLGIGVAALDRVGLGDAVVADRAGRSVAVAPIDGGGEVGGMIARVGVGEGGDCDGAGVGTFGGADRHPARCAQRRVGNGRRAGGTGGVAAVIADRDADGVGAFLGIGVAALDRVGLGDAVVADRAGRSVAVAPIDGGGE